MKNITIDVFAIEYNRRKATMVISTTDCDSPEVKVSFETLAKAIIHSSVEAAMVMNGAKDKITAVCMITVGAKLEVQIDEDDEIVEISNVELNMGVVEDLREYAMRSIFA